MKSFLGSFLGAVVGALLFFFLATYFFGHPFQDWFMSAHGIFSAENQKDLSEPDRIVIYQLLSRGLIISSDSIVSNISDLYGNLIQTLVGLLAVTGFLALFAVRWQSIQAAEDYVDKKTNELFGSDEFKAMVKSRTEDYVDTLDPLTNPQVASVSSLTDQLAELRVKVEELENYISSNASAEEPEE